MTRLMGGLPRHIQVGGGSQATIEGSTTEER